MIRDRFSKLADRATRGVLDFNIVSSYGRTGFVLRSREFDKSDLAVDMSGRVCVVTGANSGIGLAAARALATHGATVYLVCRNKKRGEEAIASIAEATGSTDHLHLIVADVANQRELRTLAEGFEGRVVDVLINNAGGLHDERQETEDGFELTFATHVLAPFLLSELLLPCLRRSTQGRIINVTSGGMYLKRLDLDALETGGDDFNGSTAYANCKRALVILTEQLAERLEGSSVVVNSVHPGWVNTPGVEHSLPRFYRMTRSILRDPEQGADSIVWLAISDKGAASNGTLWFDRAPRRTHLFPWTLERKGEREELWELCSRCTALPEEFAESPEPIDDSTP